MSIFFKLNITDNDARLTDSSTLGTDRVCSRAVALNLVGATVLALHGRHPGYSLRNSIEKLGHIREERTLDRFDPLSVFLKQEFSYEFYQ